MAMTMQRRTSLAATVPTRRSHAGVRACAFIFALLAANAALADFARFGPVLPEDSGVVAVSQPSADASLARESRPLFPDAARPEARAESAGPGHAVAQEAPRTAAALVVVLAIAAAIFLGLRAIAKRTGGFAAMLGPGGRAPAGVLEVLGRYPVGRGQTLVILKLDRRVLLVSQTGGGRLGGGGFQTLCELSEPDDVASILRKTRDESSESMSSRFQQMLKTFDRGHESRGADPTRIVTSIAPAPIRVRPAPPAPSSPATPMTGRDAAAALRSRLDALRQAEAASVELSQASRLREVRA
ncbi:MAG: hypothetical protein EA378_08150 [Phycisphaerales bacterium]|nr:MAG: hypothetical protein EA378_08150 [Phycisphaerales bacterium]